MNEKLELDLLMEQIKKDYLITLPDQLEEAENLLLKMENEESSDFRHQSLTNILRIIHSMKGTSGTYGLMFLSTICHKIENYIEESFDVKTNNLNQNKIDQLLKIIDLLKDYVNNIDSGEKENNKYSLKLNEIIKSNSSKENKKVDSKIYHALTFSNFEKKQIKLALNDKSITLFWANNELEILSSLLHHPCDGVIIPYNLSLMNGNSFAKAIRSIDNISKSLKIILCTSEDNLEKIPEINFLVKKILLLSKIFNLKFLINTSVKFFKLFL